MRKISNMQAQTLREKFTPRHLLGVLLWILFVFSCFFYVFAAAILGDPWWFRPEAPFTALPSQFTIVKQDQERVIQAGDPQFVTLRDAYNAAINAGYEGVTIGFSDVTWNEMQRTGYYIDATYAEPIQLGRRSTPASQLRILIEGPRNDHAGLLFNTVAANRTVFRFALTRLNLFCRR